VLRIDPAVPPVWSTPDRLQFGLDPVLAVLDPVPLGAERVVHALTLGTSRRALEAIAAEGGVDDLDGLLDRLAPAMLRRGAPAPAPLRVAIDAPEDLATLLRPLLVPVEPDGVPDVVVVAAHHLIPPAATVRRLADDIPHVGLVFGDQAAVVGPLVLPGRTPCLRCADEHRLADPTWRAVAAQLLRRTTSRTATSLRTRLAASAALGDALESLHAGEPTGLEGAALRIGADGAVSRLPRPWHEACWCRSPIPAPRESATDGAPPAAAPPSAPTTAAAGPAPA
jgi:hypothetical protein